MKRPLLPCPCTLRNAGVSHCSSTCHGCGGSILLEMLTMLSVDPDSMKPPQTQAAQVNRGMWINALSDPDVDVRIQAACAAERAWA